MNLIGGIATEPRTTQLLARAISADIDELERIKNRIFDKNLMPAKVYIQIHSISGFTQDVNRNIARMARENSERELRIHADAHSFLTIASPLDRARLVRAVCYSCYNCYKSLSTIAWRVLYSRYFV